MAFAKGTTVPWDKTRAEIEKTLQKYEATKFAYGWENDSAVILSKITKIEVDKIRGMARAKYATALQPQLIQPVLDMAFMYGGLPRHVDAGEMIGHT